MTTLSREDARQLVRDMTRIRRFEERCVELYSAGKIRGFMHLYIGEEAVAVGVMRNLTPDDAIVATYREHGHALVRGVSAASLMAEMFGKVEGCSRGRGGSMHIFDVGNRFYGGLRRRPGDRSVISTTGTAVRTDAGDRLRAAVVDAGCVITGGRLEPTASSVRASVLARSRVSR